MRGVLLFLYFLLFLCGVGLYWLKRADNAVRNPTTTIKTKHEWLEYYAAPLAYRSAFEIAAFWAWAQYPTLFFGYVNDAWGTKITLPMNIATVLGAGLLADSMLDWAAQFISRRWPSAAFLTREVPVIPAVKQAIESSADVQLKPKE